MKKSMLWVLVAVGLGVVGYLVGSRLTGTGPADAGPPSEEITYICRETGALIRGPREPGPEGIEAGDCKTLVQALYCPACQTWYPMPPPEALASMPMGPRCPKHRTGLFEEVPEPETAATSP
jgi:uncharacterized protein YbaR (Trm112 family)